MKRIVSTFLVLALLPVMTACGDAEDFTVTTNKSAMQIVSAIGHFDFASEASYLPNLAITTERPSEHEIVYTIPARELPDKQTGQSIIRLTMEPGDEANESIIHAFVDIPPVRVLMGEAGKELSEEKVEAELNKALTTFDPGKVRELLVAVAVASNINYQSLANTAQLPSGHVSGGFGAVDSGVSEFDESDWGQ